MRDEAVQRIRRQHAEGARIVIATATERRLAEALLAAAGIPYDLLSASILIETPSGMEFADHRVGTRKAEALREQGVPIETVSKMLGHSTVRMTERYAKVTPQKLFEEFDRLIAFTEDLHLTI